MQIGIDLGGSHIAVGLIQEGKVLRKQEKDFEEEKEQIEEVILYNYVVQIVTQGDDIVTTLKSVLSNLIRQGKVTLERRSC